MDHRQVLWMATDDGLYYLDDKGSRLFMNFKSPISDVAEDGQGRLWVATNKGLQVINQIRNHSIPLTELGLKASFASSPNMQIERLPNQEMAILAGAHLYRYLPLTRKLIVQCQLPQPEGNVVFNMKYVAKEDAFYLSHSTKPLFRVHKNHISNIFFPIVYQKKNKLTQHNYQNYRLGQTQALGDSLSYFYMDDETYLWDHKQFMRDGFFLAATSLASKAPFWRAILQYTQARNTRKFDISYKNFTPLDICKDNEGNLYVASVYGLFIVQKRKRLPFQTLPFFSDKSIRGIKQDPEGNLIVGSYSGSYRYSLNQQRILQKYIPYVIGWDFQFSEKNWIVACEAYDCLVKIPNYTIKPSQTPGISSKKKVDQLLLSRQFQTPILINPFSFPKRLIKTHSGFLAPVENELYFLDPQGSIVDRFDLRRKNSRYINETENYACIMGKDSILWLGGNDGLIKVLHVSKGAALVSQDTMSIPKTLKNEDIRALYEDRQGRLWVGTQENGLVKFDPKNKQLKKFTTREGLAENTIYSIQGSHADSLLWIGTQHGLSCLNTISGAIVNFFKKDGLAHDEFNTGSSYRSPDGTLFFGGVQGLTYFKPWRPDFFPSNLNPYTTIELITRKINQRQLFTLDHNQTLDVPPQVGLIAIQAHTTNHKASPSDIEMKYRLSGVQENWQTIYPAERLMFSGLSPGKYVLSLKARYKNDYWSRPAKIFLRIKPYWYQTWVFKILVVFALIGFLILWYQLRIQAIKEAMRVRQQISDDLHDDLGTRIYALRALGSQLANNLSDNPKETAVQFETLGTDILQKIRDMIWGFDTNRDQLVYFIDRMEDFAEKNIKPNVVVFSFEDQITQPNQSIDGLIRHHILMVYQELLVNMIKHTNCQEIHIKVLPKAKGLRLTIINTHEGYKNQTEEEGGRGLESIQKRLAAFKGQLNWTEEVNFQEAELVFPFQ
jgi:streptogramin lyase